jgi:MFS family permease
MIAMLLYLFYSWMVIYTPIHLIETGFTWEQIGIIFTVMLVPFVVVEYPAGWLADRYLGETEMLTLGFAIMVLSVLALMFVTGYWMVMLVLFLSRVGASLVEIMRDTYFYKKVDEDDIDLVDLFRNTRSIAYVFGPFLASGILTLGYGIPQIFLVLAVLMFVGLLIPFHIEDTL